jgi:hypothetical protein
MTRIHLLESVYLADGAEALPSLRTDIDAIEHAVASVPDCRLVVIDPVSAYLAGTDDHRNGELRGVLSPLKAMAERTGAAVVLVTHLNKGASTNGKHRVTGSIAYVGACRANFLFVRDREDTTSRRVLMCDNGCTLIGDVPTLAYSIGDGGDGPTVLWEQDPVEMTAEQALAAEGETDETREARAESRACADWLRQTLKAAGPMPANDAQRAGRDSGYTPKQMRTARAKIGAKTTRVGYGPGSRCYWHMPDQEVPADSGGASIDAPDPS